MLRLVLLISLSMLFSPHAQLLTQEQPTGTPSPTASGIPLSETPAATQFVSIQSPLPGQALQGNIPVSGNLAVTGFSSAELLFSYAVISRFTSCLCIDPSMNRGHVDRYVMQYS